MDHRIDYIFRKHTLNDKSFRTKESPLALLFGGNKYSKEEARQIWERGIKYGIELGLYEASPQGQRIQLDRNTEPHHREFLEKMYALCEEHRCSIEYHPTVGMIVLDKRS